MHLNPSLANGSLDAAIEALAQRAVAIQRGAPRLTKQAFDTTKILQQLGDRWRGLDPITQKAIAGAGIGGVAGLGSSFRRPKEERKSGRSLFAGALAGGALGAGLGMAGKYAPQPAASDAQGRPVLPDNQMYGPDGKIIRLKPGVKISPEQAELMRQNATPSSDALNTVVGEGLKATWKALPNSPLTASATILKLLRGRDPSSGGYRYHLDPARSGNARYADSALAEALFKMGIEPGKPASHTRTTTPAVDPVTKAPMFDPATGQPIMSVNHTTVDATLDKLKNESAHLQVVQTLGEREALQALSRHASDTRLRPAIQRYLATRDPSVLPVAIRNQLAPLQKSTLDRLMSRGAELDMPKKVQDMAGTPWLRRSRLWESANNGLLRRLTRGRSRIWGIDPSVNMSKWSGKARTVGKYAPLLAGSAILENWIFGKGRDYLNRKSYERVLEKLTEPVQQGS